MQISYSKNFVKIYFYQVLSIVLGFASLFIVIPFMSSNQTMYGIYSVCISITVFLAYADLGFLGAGMKYAAESYSNGNRKNEIELIGFSHFILFLFVMILSGIFIYLSYYPNLLIKGIENKIQINIAHNLLLILAIFSPTIVLQRAIQMIFGIRLHDYILQRVTICGNLLKIASAFYFFRTGIYDIVGYFLFLQIVNLVCAVTGCFIASRKYDYDFKLLFKAFKFDLTIYTQTKKLAFSSLFATISWVLYYELDSFAIGRLLGAKDVAIYAIGFSMLTFFRSLLGTLFSPFSARFNHFIGDKNFEGLKSFFLHVMIITFPLVVLPIIAVFIFAKPLVISWVGVNYLEAIDVVKVLILCNIFAFISYPAGMLLVAKERLKDMYIINILIPIVYWSGIFLSINYYGVLSFALFKTISFILSCLIYLIFSLKFLDMSFWNFLKRCIYPYLPSLVFITVFLYIFSDYFIDGKNKMNLLINAAIIGAGISLSILLSVLTNNDLKKYLKKTYTSFIN